MSYERKIHLLYIGKLFFNISPIMKERKQFLPLQSGRRTEELRAVIPACVINILNTCGISGRYVWWKLCPTCSIQWHIFHFMLLLNQALINYFFFPLEIQEKYVYLLKLLCIHLRLWDSQSFLRKSCKFSCLYVMLWTEHQQQTFAELQRKVCCSKVSHLVSSLTVVVFVGVICISYHIYKIISLWGCS